MCEFTPVHFEFVATLPCFHEARVIELSCDQMNFSLHRESKKGDTVLLSISLLNID